MEHIRNKIIPGLQFTQVAWVVRDIDVSRQFFEESLGLNFSKAETIRAKDFKGTYYGKPSDAESLVSMTYSGGTFIELIQPLTGPSIFQDYLDKYPAGGIQHLAYSIPVKELRQVMADFEEKGFRAVTTYDHPIANIVFFDTCKEMGVMTEIMGITAEGEKAVRQMKDEMA